MSVLLLDCSSGLSGAALAGALVDLGVKPSVMEWELSLLPLGPFHLHFDRRDEGGVAWSIHAGATHVERNARAHDDEHDHHDGDGHHHHDDGPVWPAPDAVAMLREADLSPGVSERARVILSQLGESKVTLAQLAATVCVAAGWETLRPERVAFFGRGSGPEEAVGAVLAGEHPAEPGVVPPLADARRGIGFDPATGARVVAVWGAAIV